MYRKKPKWKTPGPFRIAPLAFHHCAGLNYPALLKAWCPLYPRPRPVGAPCVISRDGEALLPVKRYEMASLPQHLPPTVFVFSLGVGGIGAAGNVVWKSRVSNIARNSRAGFQLGRRRRRIRSELTRRPRRRQRRRHLQLSGARLDPFRTPRVTLVGLFGADVLDLDAQDEFSLSGKGELSKIEEQRRVVDAVDLVFPHVREGEVRPVAGVVAPELEKPGLGPHEQVDVSPVGVNVGPL